MNLRDRLEDLSQSLAVLQGKREQLKATYEDYTYREAAIKEEIELLSKARELYQKGSTALRLTLSEKFADLATRALRYIFQREDITFVVDLDVRTNLPAATFWVEIGGCKRDPKEALGGSVYEIIGLCLRLVCLEVFDLKGPLMLDEPLRSVDGTNLSNALEFLYEYCRASGRQLFIVTHNDQIVKSGDKVFTVTQRDGVSFIEEEKYV